MKLQCGRYQIDLRAPVIMGIVNLTDDSFSHDGLHGDAARAIEQGMRMVEAGAGMLDLGAESSRPGAKPVSVEEEIARLLPVIDGLRDCGLPLSIDTTKPEVMRAALEHGADMINDIAALQAPGALDAVAGGNAAICLMHMQGTPQTMQLAPHYGNVVDEVAVFLTQRVDAAQAAGIAANRIVIDPGFGFGKSLQHNLHLLRNLRRIRTAVPLPLLVGMSRKSMLGQITGRVTAERVHASVAAAVIALDRGANIIRVHDVAATRDALAVWKAVEEEQDGS